MLKLPPRFWKKVSVEPSGCWLWTRGKYKDGYGGFKLDGKMVKVHRLSYQHFKGDIPEGLCVCHSCDNPVCVNPAHLWVGTNDDNITDKVGKWRHAHGERHGRAKLIEADVLAIRSDHRSLRKIAADYGIDNTQVSKIKRRIRWSHVDD